MSRIVQCSRIPWPYAGHCLYGSTSHLLSLKVFMFFSVQSFRDRCSPTCVRFSFMIYRIVQWLYGNDTPITSNTYYHETNNSYSAVWFHHADHVLIISPLNLHDLWVEFRYFFRGKFIYILNRIKFQHFLIHRINVLNAHGLKATQVAHCPFDPTQNLNRKYHYLQHASVHHHTRTIALRNCRKKLSSVIERERDRERNANGH